MRSAASHASPSSGISSIIRRQIIRSPDQPQSTTSYPTTHKPRQIRNPYSHLIALLTESESPSHAAQIHAKLITSSYLPSPLLHTQLINLYARCDFTSQALLTLQTVTRCSNIITWTSLISHLSQSHQPYRALTLFSQLLRSTSLSPNHFTVAAILPACAETGKLTYGQQAHALARKLGLETDVFVASALLDMYAKCADMSSSKKVFDEMPVRNLVSWNSLIVGFRQNKDYDMAMLTFRDMFVECSLSLDQVSLSSVLSACANSRGGASFGKAAHAIVVKIGLGRLAYVNNSLIDMYSKCSCFDEAFQLFTQCTAHRDVVTWNVMMMGLVHGDRIEEACKYVWAMKREGIAPDETSFSTALHACASLATWAHGAAVHDQIIKTGFDSNRCVGGCLISMYAKCGCLDDAYRAFEESKGNSNVVAWTAMIAAFQQHGHGDRVIQLFDVMLQQGIEPDYITFVCVLSACSHNGLVEQGFEYFNSMSGIHKMAPGIEHYACMVDMLGRAGRLEEAKRFITTMPIEPSVSVCGALLAACRSHSDLEMGKEVAQKLFKLEPDNPGNYVLLSNMYASRGMLEEAKEVRRLMGMNGVRKETGCSWIDIKNKTFVFTVGDRSHAQTKEIYEMLAKMEELVKQKGYVADTKCAVNDVGDEHKEQGLWYHSERLALAFGLINLPEGVPLRIKKNLRTCADCHAVMKLISNVFRREIILRDTNRFHRFLDGSCSCRDYY